MTRLQNKQYPGNVSPKGGVFPLELGVDILPCRSTDTSPGVGDARRPGCGRHQNHVSQIPVPRFSDRACELSICGRAEEDVSTYMFRMVALGAGHPVRD